MSATGPEQGGIREAALTLRLQGASIRVISSELGVPRATLGDWLRGVGTPGYYVVCEQCGRADIKTRSHARYCSAACRWAAFGCRS